jgi:hypothetical protein
MKTLPATFLIVCLATCGSHAATTINAVNKFAYGANIGWVNWRGDVANGAVIGEYVCSGYIYSVNVGWIKLGDGTPANGIHYANNVADDCGVNHDGAGNLRGYAYGANIGWVKFEDLGAPKIDLKTGNLTGYAYGINVGWIKLSNSVSFVQTDAIRMGLDSDGDGLADAWELTHAAGLGVLNGPGDNDGDGRSNLEEYVADTDPLDPTSILRLTAYDFGVMGSPVTLTWSSRPTRVYYIQKLTEFIEPAPYAWVDSGLGLICPDLGDTTSRMFDDPGFSQRFFRIEVLKPLSP